MLSFAVLQISTADMAAWEQLKRDSSSGSGSSSPEAPASPAPPASPADNETGQPGVQKDWKGDPIKFNPGELVWSAVQ